MMAVMLSMHGGLTLSVDSPLVIARSSCDEAIQAVSPENFWIASLRSQ